MPLPGCLLWCSRRHRDFQGRKKIQVPVRRAYRSCYLSALFLTKSVGAFLALGFSVFIVIFLYKRLCHIKISGPLAVGLFVLLAAGLFLIVKTRGFSDIMSDFSGRLENYVHMLTLSAFGLFSAGVPATLKRFITLTCRRASPT